MDAWIDTYHAVRSLTREGTPVFLTDSAVGLKEEDNLRHLVSNLGSSTCRGREIVPFLTCKHPLDFCTAYADRAVQQGFQALVVLGGDKSVGPPRCVEHAWQLREEIRRHQPKLALGGWANPHASIERAGRAPARRTCHRRVLPDADRLASQRRARAPVRRRRAARRGLAIPGMFGVFYYRSANPRTLEALKSFLPVPAEELSAEFAAGASPEESARGRFASCAPPARATSTSATCRCSARR